MMPTPNIQKSITMARPCLASNPVTGRAVGGVVVLFNGVVDGVVNGVVVVVVVDVVVVVRKLFVHAS